MFTNEQVRTAMGQLVKMKGENHTSFGRYQNPETMEAACFLGCLAKMMRGRIPSEGTSAYNILGIGGVTKPMEIAFAVAQNLNDQHYEWKYVLMAVDKVLAVPENELIVKKKRACPCGCTSNESPRVRPILDEIAAIRSLDKGFMQKDTYAAGGIITADMIPQVSKITMNVDGIKAFSTAMNEFSYNLTAATNSLSKITVTGNLQEVAAKKDHALVA